MRNIKIDSVIRCKFRKKFSSVESSNVDKMLALYKKQTKRDELGSSLVKKAALEQVFCSQGHTLRGVQKAALRASDERGRFSAGHKDFAESA